MLNITNYQGHANPNYKIAPYTNQNGHHQKINKKSGEDVEKGESFYTVGGNVNWYRHYGDQYGGSLKILKTTKKSYHMTQQSQSWACIQRKQ